MDQSNHDGQRGSTGTSSFGLRDRKALRPSLTAVTGLDKLSPGRRSSRLQTFSVPPRRVSRRILPSDLTFQSPSLIQRTKLDNSIIDSPDDQLVSELSNATADLGPKRDFDQDSSHERLEEPDLPPTPTQLGLERPPERPKGLLSSSPPPRGKLGKRQIADQSIQSLSKLRNVHHEEREESLHGSGSAKSRNLLADSVLARHKLKKELAAQSQQLKDHINELETWSKRSAQHGKSVRELGELIPLLLEDHPSTTPEKPQSHGMQMSYLVSTLLPFSTKDPETSYDEPLIVNPFAVDELSQLDSYLTVFAPLNLESRFTTTHGSTSDVILETHTLTLSVPPPFPKILEVPIMYESNPTTQSIVNVMALMGTSNVVNKQPVYLRQWIETRLANPLLKLDVSGLCWGINRFWEASLLRAQLWVRLKDQCREKVAGCRWSTSTCGPSDSQGYDNGALTTWNFRKVLPHLDRTSMLFESGETIAPKVYVSCELKLDEWMGEPKLVPGITVSAPSDLEGKSGRKLEQEAKLLFYEVLNGYGSNQKDSKTDIDADTIVRAAICVLSVVFNRKRERKSP
ncbi:hypothetical protein BDV25DRAFT_163222 [Aspergillus avenaceus]|uniref:Uncharacterized protein n=1 Tax=Aspergillus avenaceus TaxID=36643 RepID=A0A5N6TIJ8_ASPAV|nr:hypothetical protein BDV25DRAFT_163222 [Aspergillus avenaceus]